MESNMAFIHENFLLHNERAIELYHRFAANQPIIDYHNHLPPENIARDLKYQNITRLWIAGDHYKWRAMRAYGIDEHYITGKASDKEKFLAWASTVPHTLRNPLFHWTHLELKRYFGIDEFLTPDNAERLYDQMNERLKDAQYSCRGLLRKMNVQYLCTTEGPRDTLEYHQQLRKEQLDFKVSTAFRPDEILDIPSDTFLNRLEELSRLADIAITSFQSLCDVLRNRIDFFHENGCRLSDHGMVAIPFTYFTETEVHAIFSKRLKGGTLTAIEVKKFQTALLLFLGETYHEHDWVQQFHLGAIRNINTRRYNSLGPDSGWDTIGDSRHAESMAAFFDALEVRNKLGKTIIYNLNPADNYVFATMVGNFNDGSVKGKMQYGAAWWFLDQKQGITQQINALSNTGLLSGFIGMLTDSRSFMSFPRHEYFRRILADILGSEMQRGELPDDMEWVGGMLRDICYGNAKEYFSI